MKKLRLVAAFAATFVAGMAATVTTQILCLVQGPFTMQGEVTSLYVFPTATYVVAVVALLAVAGLFYEASR